jgi:hypothetical protein
MFEPRVGRIVSRRRHRRLLATLAATLLASSLSTTALAYEVGPRARAPLPDTFALTGDVYVGGYGTTAAEGGQQVFGLEGALRIHDVELGMFADVATDLMASSMRPGPVAGCSSWGGLAGVSVPIHRNVRVAVLGELGLHRYSNVGESSSSSWTGTSGESAFAGVRIGASWERGESTRLSLGGWLFIRSDFDREDVPVPGMNRSVTVGGRQIGLMARVGFDALIL